MFINRVKEVAVIHDLSGMGKVSLIVVVPILSSMEFQVRPLSTAIPSNHTQYSYFTFLDLTDEMPCTITEWERLEVRFDVIYTGYLESSRQIQIVSDFIRDFRRKDSSMVIDPALGDNGKLYSNFDEAMAVEAQQLITHVDVTAPNLAELLYLLGHSCKETSANQELRDYLHGLPGKGPEVVVTTSVSVLGEPHRASVYTYNRTGDRYWRITYPYLLAHCPDTGDTFTNVITGTLLQGDSLPIALDRATRFTLQGIRATFDYEYDDREGILLEKILHNLDMPIQSSSYELTQMFPEYIYS